MRGREDEEEKTFFYEWEQRRQWPELRKRSNGGKDGFVSWQEKAYLAVRYEGWMEDHRRYERGAGGRR